MPIYEFTCKDCGRDSERLLPTSDWKGTKCPACGSGRLMKKLSVFSSATAAASPSTPCGGPPGGACGSCACSANSCQYGN